jgi:Lrp/AsnC family transcriptional regulator for asnA, asnC and gidA
LTKSSKTQSVLEKLALIPNVTTANVISGKYNIYCKISAKDAEDAKNVIYKIDDIDDVLRTESMISLEESINDHNRLMDALFK